MKRTAFVASALSLTLAASTLFAQDKMRDERNDAMEHDSMGKPATKRDKMDRTERSDKMDRMEKPGAAY